MKDAAARLAFVGICIVLAFLLLTKVIKIFVGGVIFAAALLALGLLWRRVRR